MKDIRMASSGRHTGGRLTGLTGGIASGKSRVASFLARRFNLLSLSADKAAHELLEPGKPGWRFISDINPAVIQPDGTINKPRFRSELFQDEKLRQKINAVMHPLVWETMVADINRKLESFGNTPVLLEVPLLYEAGWQDRFDEVIVVFADRETCGFRLTGRDRVSIQQAERELAAQMALFEKCLLAEHVVDNSGSWALTLAELLHLGKILWPENKKSAGAGGVMPPETVEKVFEKT